MTLRKTIFSLAAAVVALSGVASLHSCDEISDCSIEGRPMINCRLYKVDPATDATSRDTLTSLTITALGTDSIIVNRESNVSSCSVPLSYISGTTVLVFHYDYDNDPALSDTITISHNNTPYFESLDCGYSVKQEVTDVSHTKVQIDSIRIEDVNTNTNDIENLKIYYRYTY
jgi:hypothetical protein